MSSSVYAQTWRCPHCAAEVEGASPGDACPQNPAHALVPETVIQRIEVTGKDPLLGRVIGGYATIDRLGSGGFGGVYRAVRGIVTVALKVVDPARSNARSDIRGRFLLEARILAEIQAPGLVQVHEAGEADGLLFMVQDLIEGETLFDVLRDGALPVERAVNIAIQILDALAQPHERGLIHRDIKPSNIMISAGDRVRVIDFGIAKDTARDAARDTIGVPDDPQHGPRTQTGVIIGTPRYMAPEQLTFEAVTPRTDQYAVGVLTYEMLVGRTPFGGSPGELIAAHLKDPVPDLPDVHPAVAEVVRRMLAKSPNERFSSGAEAASALRGDANKTTEQATVVMPIVAPTEVMDADGFSEDDVTVIGLTPLPAPEPAPAHWRLPLLLLIAVVLGVLVGTLPRDPQTPVQAPVASAPLPARVYRAGPGSARRAVVLDADLQPGDPFVDAEPPREPDVEADAQPVIEPVARPRPKPRPKPRQRPRTKSKPKPSPAIREIQRVADAARAALRKCQCRVADAHIKRLKGLPQGATLAKRLSRQAKRCIEPDVDERCQDGQTLPR